MSFLASIYELFACTSIAHDRYHVVKCVTLTTSLQELLALCTDGVALECGLQCQSASPVTFCDSRSVLNMKHHL
jgi:hypothetical protein